jgi:nucleotide-binding universal stress UspA family protein
VRRHTTTDPAPPARDIVFATDFSRCSAVAAKIAAEYARTLNARLHVLHITLAVAGKKHVDGLKAIKEDMPTHLPVVTAVETGSPAAQIVRYAERVGADLIVLGTHGRTGVSRAILGSVAERVVRTAGCPVLAVPMRYRNREPERELPAAAPVRQVCLVCGKSSEDLICEACRNTIRAESLDRKLEAMRKGKP